MNTDNLIIFSKTLRDFLNDLTNTFNDKIENTIKNNSHYTNIINFDYDNYINKEETQDETLYQETKSQEINEEDFLQSVDFIFKHVIAIIPENFFNILYTNEQMFQKDSLYLLPDINFSELFLDPDISDKTKEAMWKYLQLISFTIITSIEDKDSFGNNQKLFEAIDSDVFKNKLEETINNMSDLFQNNISDISNIDLSFNDPSFNLPNTQDIHNHINNLLNGKLGKLATEIASEVMDDMEIDPETIKDPKDLFQKLFRDPSKLMGLAKNVTGKLEERIKDGTIKESEILEEVKEMAQGFGNSDLGNFKDILKTMNLDGLLPKGGKFNTNAFNNMMEQNVKYSKMKERMQKKRADKQNTPETSNPQQGTYNGINLDTNNLNELNANLAKLAEELNTMYPEPPTQNDTQKNSNKKKNKNKKKK